MVPEADYMLPLSQAEVVVPGTDITLIGYGTQVCQQNIQIKRNFLSHEL